MKHIVYTMVLGVIALSLTLLLSACGGGKEWTDVYSKKQGATEQQDGSDAVINGDGDVSQPEDNAPNANDQSGEDTVDNSEDTKEQSGSWLDWPGWIWNWFDGDDDDKVSSKTSSKGNTVTTSTKPSTTTSTVTSLETSSEEESEEPSSETTPTTSTKPVTPSSSSNATSSKKPTTTSNDGWTGDYIINTKPR